MMKLHRLRPENTIQSNGYAVWGCYWPEGSYTKEQEFRCVNSMGTEVLMNSRVTAYWPDGTVKWTAHSALARELGEEIQVEAIAPTVDRKLLVEKKEKEIRIQSDLLEVRIPMNGSVLLRYATLDSQALVQNVRPVLIFEESASVDGNETKKSVEYLGEITNVQIEAEGPAQCCIRYEGLHTAKDGRKTSPFIVRLEIGMGSPDLHFTHTFIYDGEEEQDALKGLGLRFESPLQGPDYNRHIKILGDYGSFHEASALLSSWRPKLPELYAAQFSGEVLTIQKEQEEAVDFVLANMPHWSNYSLTQDQANHFSIKKSINEEKVSFIRCLDGERSKGVISFGSEKGSVMVGVKDFWQKYPMGIDVSGLTEDTATCDVWFHSPKAEVQDFRHYAQRGYNQVYYEGFDYKGGQAKGVGNTNRCSIQLSNQFIAKNEEMELFYEQIQSPAIYVADPEFYHERKVFGFWSLPSRKTAMENWIEDQLDRLFNFYKNEIEQRNWYGFYNYGDFMHSYDALRHNWKYDMGGYAWDNTELVPTLWLWLYFMRSGREDVFRLAENLSLHTSEVDVYHLGEYQGLGSRHNVSHWGCPCKEARVSMAYHHRYYYYLTGDRRTGEILEEVKDNESSLLAKDPLGDFYEKSEMKMPTHARTGPDWSSLCGNWLTHWERSNDVRYREKMEIGMQDIKEAPLQLISGPDFEFDPSTYHLGYIGERTTGGTHLQICMGAPQIWFEMADIMHDELWKKMLADYGRFYYLDAETQQKESKGLIGDREFSLPFMAAAVAAYAANYLDDKDLGEHTWTILLETLMNQDSVDGFVVNTIENAGNHAALQEIPWISTNYAAQFGLNTICALDMIREHLPETLEEMKKRIGAGDQKHFRKA